jgi:Leucine-rich repeat (LRR) protein
LKVLIFNYIDLGGSIPPQLGNLSNLEILKLNGNHLNGIIPGELGNLLNLKELDLSGNRFNDVIPPELGKLTCLQKLRLANSHLIGSIPRELGNLTDLQDINLNNNKLEGSIPPELGNLTNLQHLWLQFNRLSGQIPPELGDLPRLQQLQLQGNRLSGTIPINLTGLRIYMMDISYNGLYTTEAVVHRWLKRLQSSWSDTQTTAPVNVSAVSISSSSIKVSWTPIKYKEDKGGYEVYYSTSPRGPWISAEITANKSTSSFEITGLSPGKKYYFVVQTRTNPHSKNKNTVVSQYSKVVFATINQAE